MSKLKYSVLSFAIALCLIGGISVATVSADTYSEDFEAFSAGSVNGQNGWSVTGPYDQEVVSSTTISGSRSFRISNGTATGSFGDQTFSKSLVNEVGESVSTNNGMSGGTRQNHFESSFDFKSTSADEQPGLFISISPDRGDGSRMSYIGLSDTSGGIDVIFYDVQGTSNPANFVATGVATGLSRTDVHNAKFVIDIVEGPSNDIVKIYIDGNLVHTGTTWENYYRYDSESSAEQTPRTIDNLLFRAGGASVPSTTGNGYVFDNLSLSSSMTPLYPRNAEITAPTAGQDIVKGNVNFTAFLDDDDVDAVQWAVRQGTCNSGISTVFGNVDGKSNVATIDSSNLSNQTFSFVGDMSTMSIGSYCFIYNPSEDSGETDLRKTVQFNLIDEPVVVTAPTDKDQCKNGGWESFTNPSFKNQGQCVSYVQASPKAGKKN